MSKIRKFWISREEFFGVRAGDRHPLMTIDFDHVGGLTAGSIPFADATGFLAEDNTALFWDAAQDFLGVGTGAPLCRIHFRGVVCPDYVGLHPDTILLVENDDSVYIQLQGATNANAGIIFADDNVNPPAGMVRYDFANDQIEFGVATNEVVWFSAAGAKFGLSYVWVDSGGVARFIADSHNADAYFELEEDTVLKWTVGFDFTDSLKFQISEGLPGVGVRFEIEPTAAGLINLYLDVGIRNSQDLRFYDNGNYVGFKPPALAADQIWVLPNADAPAANQCLKSDGAGNLDWSQALGTTDSPLFANLNLGAAPFIRQSAGALTIQTDEGVNTSTIVYIKGKGTGFGAFRLYDQDNAEYLELSGYSGRGIIKTGGVAPSRLDFQNTVAQDITFWRSLTAGNPWFEIWGWHVTDVDWMRMRVEADGDGLIEAENNLNIIAGGGDIFFGNENIGVNQSSFGANSVGVLAQGTGTAPTTSPADAFQMYSADIGGAAGKAGAHFRDEEGNVVSLGTGGVLMSGTARVGNDQYASPMGIKAPQTKPATWIEWGISGVWQFADGDDETIVVTYRVLHRMDRSVAPNFHVKWSTAGIGAGNCEWQLEYLWRAPDEDTTAIAQDTENIIVAGSGVAANGLVVSNTLGLDLPSATDNILMVRVKRLAAGGNDTIADTVELHGINLHFTANKLGEPT